MDMCELGQYLIFPMFEGDLTKLNVVNTNDVIQIALEIGQGIAFLHKAFIVHRDIKPANILYRICSNGKRTFVLCDYGLAKKGTSIV